jgi:hypothetical protein
MTDARTTQTVAEHWLTTTAPGVVTQVAVEHWAAVGSVTVQALSTQIAVEHWVSIAGPAAAQQYAVTVNTG